MALIVNDYDHLAVTPQTIAYVRHLTIGTGKNRLAEGTRYVDPFLGFAIT